MPLDSAGPLQPPHHPRLPPSGRVREIAVEAEEQQCVRVGGERAIRRGEAVRVEGLPVAKADVEVGITRGARDAQLIEREGRAGAGPADELAQWLTRGAE